MADESFRVSRIGLEHFEAFVPGHVGDLDQIGAALDRARDEARSQAMAAECGRVEAEPSRAGLGHCRNISACQAPIGDALVALVEDASEDRALGVADRIAPSWIRLLLRPGCG